MNRRTFLTTSSAAAAGLILPNAVLAAQTLTYTPGLVNTRLAAGETLFIDYKASWCSTCARQERVINALRAANPAYDAAITFINVDWDEFGNTDITKRFNVPRRSALVAVKGNSVLGMLVAQTSESSIQGLLDTALSAATA